MTDTKMVTAWTMAHGYVRMVASAEYLRLDEVSDRIGDLDEARHLTGYSSLAHEFDQHSSSSIDVLEHETQRSLLVDLWSGDRGIAEIHVAPEDRDAFLFVEYPQIVQRLKAAHQADALERIEKAFQAFIRFGHGTDTISEFGTTRDEARNERERLRALEKRRQETAQSGS